MPRTSFCIPVYNGGRYLEQAIESVLQQEPGDWTLLICDNASTDETADVCARFKDRRIRRVYFAEHTGQAANFNRCLAGADAEFVALLHADDYLLPGFLAPRLAIFERMPELAFVFGGVDVVDAQGRTTASRSRWKGDLRLESREVVEALLFGSVVCGPTVLFRAEAGRRAGRYRTDLTWGHDWEWMIRLAQQGDAYHLGRAHAVYREHDQSGSAQELDAGRNGAQERRILREVFARLDDPALRRRESHAFAALALRHLSFAERALERLNYAAARRNVVDALRAAPWVAAKPTFWALAAGCLGGSGIYRRYRRLRDGLTPQRNGAPPGR